MGGARSAAGVPTWGIAVRRSWSESVACASKWAGSSWENINGFEIDSVRLHSAQAA